MNNNIITNSYDIFLNVNTNKLKYKGYVTIEFVVIQDIGELEINSNLDLITMIKLNGEYQNKWEILKEKELVVIKNDFKKGEYQMTIYFKNKITDTIDGFYYTKKNNLLICCTNLEPTSARKFIPCFDYPNLKAKFKLKVLIEPNYMAISNSSINSIDQISVNNNKTGTRLKKLIEFNETPLMSTYLLCLVMGDIEPVLTNPLVMSNRVKINGWSVPLDKKYMGWSVIHTLRALDFFEKWFGIQYPLDKLDICSIPNFSSGAMENWGLVTFREEYILLYNKTNLLSIVKILEVIYHEIAHQWFGNLVTLNQWTDLWLNESTATYFAWMALEISYTDYEIKELYWFLECKGLYLTDGITGTHPVAISSNQPDKVDNSVKPEQLFDEITYSKGNTIIKYVVSLLGLDNFQKSISKYLKENIYKNPSSEKLYLYFNEFAKNNLIDNSNIPIDYVELMSQLINTKGYPILFVEPTNTGITIRIETFNLDKAKLCDFPIDIYLKIKFLKSKQSDKLIKEFVLLKSKQSEIIDCSNTYTDNFIINPNNDLFCIVKYIRTNPSIENMQQSELMKYAHDEFILYLYGYNNFDDYFQLVTKIFDKYNGVNKNDLLLVSVLTDLNKLFGLYVYFDYVECLDKFKNHLNTILVKLIGNICETNTKYMELVLDQVFISLVIYFKNSQVFKLVQKIYWEQINLVNYDRFYMSKSLFKIQMQCSSKQFDTINQFMVILDICTNVQIISNIIESFSYLNSDNFDYIFSNYKNIIRSQDYRIFFNSISKIKEKQEFIIDYWIEFNEQISQIEETRFQIFKTICGNIYETELIDKTIKYIKLTYLPINQFVFDKIIDILETNKIVSKQIKEN
jgi:aminopeptidase N